MRILSPLMNAKSSCIHGGRAVLLNKGGGVAPCMPTSEQQEVLLPPGGTCLRSFVIGFLAALAARHRTRNKINRLGIPIAYHLSIALHNAPRLTLL
jgi:hypothetical protein